MNRDENTAWLISWLESEISEYTYYRPHHTWIRYPVHMTKDGSDKSREMVGSAVTDNYADARSKYYKFGYNEFYIGQAIEWILKKLEQRYNLDFNELEENCDLSQYGLDDDDE